MVVALVSGSMVGCPAGGSRSYEPASEVEAELMKTASREARLGDVSEAQSPKLVVWAGIIRNVEARDTDSGRPVLTLEVEQRHFDWIADYGMQPERYFLSALGDGHFRASWQIPRTMSAAEVREHVHPKDMAVVYGLPQRADDGTVEMARTDYMRPIPMAEWRDDVFEYVPGGEFKKLGTPLLVAQPVEDK